MTLHISRSHGGLILTTSNLVRNEPLANKGIVDCSATGNMVFCQKGLTINNGDSTTITNLKTTFILLGLCRITVIDLFIQRSGTGNVTVWLTNLEGRSNTKIRVMIRYLGSSIHGRLIM
jgi:hypothetical protein